MSNQLSAWLKQIFPQVPRWFPDVDSRLVCDLLSRWPNLEQLQKARPATLEKFFRQHHCRDQERIQERIQAIQKAVVASEDWALREAGELAIQNLVARIGQLQELMAVVESKIEATTEAHPDRFIFDSLPAAGKVMLPRLIAALGSDRERFESASDLQCYTGIAPVVEASGKQQWTHWRWACPTFIRQSIHEWAGLTIRFCDWAKEHYERQRQKGNGHQAAVRSLAFKWERILFRCWKDRKPYQESIYLEARSKRASSKASQTFSTGKPKLLMKTCGDFTQLESLTS